MIAAIIGVACAVLVIAILIGFTAWLRFLDDDDKVRRDLKHRCHHKWTGR